MKQIVFSKNNQRVTIEYDETRLTGAEIGWFVSAYKMGLLKQFPDTLSYIQSSPHCTSSYA